MRSHQASSGKNIYDHAADRARLWGGVACNSTSAGWAVGLLEVIEPSKTAPLTLIINKTQINLQPVKNTFLFFNSITPVLVY